MEQQHNCLNCNQPLQKDDKFCSTCGQENKPPYITVWEFLVSFFDQFFNLDNRIFRTLSALMLPGRLTSAWFAGKQRTYYHPLRIFIVTLALMLSVVTYLLKNNSDLDHMNLLWEKEKSKFFEKQAYKQVDSLSEILKTEYPQAPAPEALDSLKARFAVGKNLSSPDSQTVNVEPIIPIRQDDEEGNNVKVAYRDFLYMRPKELANKYGLKGYWQRLLFVQKIRMLRAGDQIVYYALGNVIWMMLLMMPMLSLSLKLLYIRRKRYLLEHLVFSLHTHSFIFVLITLSLLAGFWIEPSYIAVSALAIAALYLLLAMKRFYGQGWAKTIAKYAFANFLYMGLFAVAAVFTATLSMLLF